MFLVQFASAFQAVHLTWSKTGNLCRSVSLETHNILKEVPTEQSSELFLKSHMNLLILIVLSIKGWICRIRSRKTKREENLKINISSFQNSQYINLLGYILFLGLGCILDGRVAYRNQHNCVHVGLSQSIQQEKVNQTTCSCGQKYLNFLFQPLFSRHEQTQLSPVKLP